MIYESNGVVFTMDNEEGFSNVIQNIELNISKVFILCFCRVFACEPLRRFGCLEFTEKE
jgi:hypothetical protein